MEKFTYHIGDTDLKPVRPNRDRNLLGSHPSLRSEFDVVGGEVEAANRVDGFPLISRVRRVDVIVQRRRQRGRDQ